MPRSPVTVLLVPLLAVASCRSTPEVEAPDASIVGVWRSADGATEISFSESGLYSLRLKDQPRPVMGSFAFNPKEGTLDLTTRRESPACGDDNGAYKVRMVASEMDLEAVRDTCELRSKAFAAPLQRARAGR